MTNETSSRKPIASTIENEKNRSRTSVRNGRPGLTTTPQIVFIESLSSANTVDAPKSSTAMLMTVATTPVVFCDALACTAD